ncbi:MAG: hypothetical protein IKZ48_07285 [Prevotella sp.]|nr:hypothetical protein [Prevotella sp.]
MKISRLLVLSALWLVGLSANAANLNERTAPEEPAWDVDIASLDMTPQEFVVGNVYALYNVGTMMYYYRGNAWDSQATGSAERALPVRFVLPNGKTLEDKALYIRDYFDRDNPARWRTAFITTGDSKVNGAFGDGTAALFTDNNDGTAALMWIEPSAAGDKLYNISISELNTAAQPEGLFLGIDPEGPGVDAGEPGTAIMPKVDVNIDWQLIAIPEMTEYFKAYDVYEKSLELKSMIEKAEEAGIDVSAAVNVYNNEASTVEQMQAAIEALQQAMAGGIGNGTAENPTDATSLINNPDFDNASSAGWSGSTPNMVGSGSHGPANVAEFYQGNNVNMYQDLSGMPAGVYRLTMYGMYRSGNAGPAYQNYLNHENYRAKLYATADGDELTTDIANPFEAQNKTSLGGATEWGVNAGESSESGFYIPNDPSCARVYFNQGWYLNTLFFEVQGGEATIGVKEDGANISGDWFPFDEFRLTYFGNTAASFQKWVELSAPAVNENAVVTTSVLQAYKDFVASKAQSATDKASAMAAVEEVKASPLYGDVQDNIAAWLDYMSALDEANKAILELMDDFVMDLADYISDSEEILAARALSTEEVKAETEKLRAMITKAYEDAKNDVKPGDDVTAAYLNNADFNKGGEHWTIGTGGCNFRENIAEAYGTTFDLYQDVESPKVGVYKLELNGFFRTGRDDSTGDAAYTSYLNGEQKCDAGVYLGTTLSVNKTHLMPVYDQMVDDGSELASVSGMYYLTGAGMYSPNDMHSAAACFEAGMYTNTAYGLVANNGETMRVGVGGVLGGSDWICWDNFKLTYMGYDAATISPILAQAVDELDLTQPMGKDVKAEAEQAAAAAAAQIGGTDGEAMFAALKAIFAVKDKVATSIDLFAELSKLIENQLYPAVTNGGVNTKATGDAAALWETLTQNIPTWQYNDSDVPGLKKQIQTVMQRMGVPDNAENASDAAPVDMSGAILTNEFVDFEGANSIAWWETEGYNFGNDETQRSAEALEYWNKPFDIYQDIEGLPNGTYEVQVLAFGRFGGNDQDLAQKQAGGQNESFLYAVPGIEGETKASAPLKFITDGVQEYSLSDEDGTMEIDGVTYYLPNSMVSFAAFKEFYVNTITVKVTDGKLRVGITKPDNSLENGWVVMDSWKLTYFGANSSKEQTGDGIENVTDAPVVMTELFTVDGRKAGNAQKGFFIQKQTLSNGQVIVKKIQK